MDGRTILTSANNKQPLIDEHVSKAVELWLLDGRFWTSGGFWSMLARTVMIRAASWSLAAAWLMVEQSIHISPIWGTKRCYGMQHQRSK